LENGLIPAIIQDADTRNVLMLGYMNTEALEKTKKTGKVTFYSRSKKRLWTKGETSGNTLKMVDMTFDCDRDTLLVKARPRGPVCHTGNETCWTEKNSMGLEFMHRLESVIRKRKKQSSRKSYTARLFEKGADQIVKKFGEEAVEVIIDAKNKDNKAFLEECADMMYHFLVLLNMKECGFEDVVNVLETRHKA
jgi:phosphoribosyl-ATP pyrophosphohydrolase/phosphoribosyl-AMP cyclohydrolase